MQNLIKLGQVVSETESKREKRGPGQVSCPDRWSKFNNFNGTETQHVKFEQNRASTICDIKEKVERDPALTLRWMQGKNVDNTVLELSTNGESVNWTNIRCDDLLTRVRILKFDTYDGQKVLKFLQDFFTHHPLKHFSTPWVLKFVHDFWTHPPPSVF